MASGERPRWGDGHIDPVTNAEAELSIATESFEPALQDGLTAFFERALHRDTEHRFDTLRQMRDAWYEMFRVADAGKPATTPATVGTVPESAEAARDAAAESAEADTPLDAAGLAPRATRSQPPHLDGRTVECIGGDGERIHVDGAFLDTLRGPEPAGRAC